MGATGRAVVLSPLGVRLAFKRAPNDPTAQGGLVHAPRRTVWGTKQLLPVVP